MKRGKVLMTVLVVMAMLFASCSNGMSKDDASGAASGEKVMVSLGVDVEGSVSQKTISTDTNLDGLTFWYKAVPQWKQDRPIHGGTTSDGGRTYYYVLIPNYTAGVESNLGYFTAGQWIFYVQVKKGDDVIYSGDSGLYSVYTNHASPEITVVPDASDPENNGTISITVKVPTTGPNETLAVNCSAGGVTMIRDPNGPGTDPNDPSTYNLIEFTGNKKLAPGAYTFTLRYTDNNTVDPAVTEAVAQAVTIFAGQTSYITGLIDGGKWHSSNITINAPGITNFTFAADGNATTVAPSTPLRYTAYAKSAQGNAITFKFYTSLSETTVVGTEEGDLYKATYDFQNGTCGMYDVTCAAIDTTAGVTESQSLYVQVGHKVIINTPAPANGTVTMGTAQTVFAPGDIVPLNVAPTSTGAYIGKVTVTGVDSSNIQTDGILGKASFKMPNNADAPVSVTFERVHFKYSAHGSVTTISQNPAAGDTVNLTVTPENGYQLNTLNIIDCDGNSVQYDANNYSFTMPTKAVTVSATFKQANP